MPEMTKVPLKDLELAQATELSLLVELEARWENLRKTPSPGQEVRPATEDLAGIQRAYDAFRSKLTAYNRRYTPAHVPELLLNTPRRLAVWCRSMQQLYLRVEHDPRARCPVHLLEKAYRCAERVSVRMNKGPVCHPSPPGTIRAAIQDLEALCQWCADLAGADRDS
jgi:hypothetical protein